MKKEKKKKEKEIINSLHQPSLFDGWYFFTQKWKGEGMWKVTKRDGSSLEIDRDNSLVIYINELNNEGDLEDIVKIERCEDEKSNRE